MSESSDQKMKFMISLYSSIIPLLLIKRMYFVAFHSSSDLLITIDVLILTLMTKPIVDYGISKNGLPFTSKMRIVDYANSSQDLI